MTHKELLKPRYKATADYPNTGFKENEVFVTVMGNSGKQCVHRNITYNEEVAIYPADYPHLFKELEWWEERTAKDMPEYMKCKSSVHPKGIVWRVRQWAINTATFFAHGEDAGFGHCVFTQSDILLPATKEDYDNYINSKK